MRGAADSVQLPPVAWWRLGQIAGNASFTSHNAG